MSIIDPIECQRDSPQFRQLLEEKEKSLELLEGKLEKVVKQCNQMVSVGKHYNQEQEQLINVMWEVSHYFNNDTCVQSALNNILNALHETVKFQAILIDQASRSVTKKLSSLIKCDLKRMKDFRHEFEKSSNDLDKILTQVSNISKSRAQDASDLNSQLVTSRKNFCQMAVNYMYTISIIEAKKRHEIVDAGTDLTDDLGESLDAIAKKISSMQTNTHEVEKDCGSYHFDVNSSDLIFYQQEPLVPSDNIVMCGYLFKRNNNAFKSWNRRYFTLQNNQLAYQKRSGEEKTVMEEDLRLCIVKEVIDIDRRFCFEIISPTRSHLLQAESSESRQAWILALSKSIGVAFHSSEKLCDSSLEGESSPNLSFNTSSSKQSLLLHDILEVNGNSTCCDCGSSNPQWASINLGITLCIECSGIHRSLGVHYSKVRSLTLDAWEPEVIKIMLELGNNIINHIYLGVLKRDGDKLILPSDSNISLIYSNCSRAVRECWIKAKYVEKKFVCPLLNTSDTIECTDSGKVNTWCVPRHHLFHRREKSSVPEHTLYLDDSMLKSEQDAEKPKNVPSDTSDSSRHFFLGEELISKRGQDISLSLDIEVSEDEEEIELVIEEPMANLTPDLVLYRASQVHNIPVMCHSLALGANKNWYHESGEAALHQTVVHGSSTSLMFLLLNGVQINIQNSCGKTALHIACAKANLAQVIMLLKHHADIATTDNDGKKAIDFALESNSPDVVTLLRVADMHYKNDIEENNLLSEFLKDFENKLQL